MRRLAFLALAAAVSACASGDASAVRVSLRTNIVFPQGVLDKVQSLHLQVWNNADGVDCDMTKGVPTGVTTSIKPIVDQDLATMCMGGAKFCGTVQMQKSTTDRVFAAVGKDGSGNVLANGCTRQNVNQDSVSVQITMLRFIPPAMCGDGIIEPTETCDAPTATDPLCTMCKTSEFLVSVPAAYPGGPAAGAAGSKTFPSLLWPAQTGAGDFLAFFSDTFSGRGQISMRALGNALQPAPDKGMAVQNGSLFVPDDPATFPPQSAASDQKHPTGAAVGSKYYVAFEDLRSIGSPTFGVDVHLHSMDATGLVVDQNPPGCGINGANGAGENGVQSFPQMAVGPGNKIFVVWQDELTGAINGRTYDTTTAPPCGALGTQQTISSSTGNLRGVVAPTSTGWVVAWQSGSTVKWRLLGADGTPTNLEQTASMQSCGAVCHPGVASLSDGAFAIAWDQNVTGSSTVYAQRFDTKGTPLAGDQNKPINNMSMGDEISPVIASTSAGGNSYVVAWVDAGPPGHVRSRLLAGETGSLGDATGSGYLFNTVTGLADEFPVSLTDNIPRANPAVVVGGGSGQYIAFVWEDASAMPGIKARRFPPPTQ
jgi:hypothetical protein